MLRRCSTHTLGGSSSPSRGRERAPGVQARRASRVGEPRDDLPCTTRVSLAALLLLATACSCTMPSATSRPTQGGEPAQAPARSALLFALPQGNIGLDPSYLDELRQHGFTVDYTESLDDLTVE